MACNVTQQRDIKETNFNSTNDQKQAFCKVSVISKHKFFLAHY